MIVLRRCGGLLRAPCISVTLTRYSVIKPHIVSSNHFHSSRQILKDNTYQFPQIKDVSPLIEKLHKNKDIPFNILRDVLHLDIYDAEEMDFVYDTMVSYVNMNDGQIIKTALDQSQSFWLKCLRLSFSTPQFMSLILQLWNDPQLRRSLEIPNDIPETLVSALIYYDKLDYSKTVFTRYVLSKPTLDIQWESILNVCLLLNNSSGLETFSSLYNEIENPQLYSTIITHLKNLHVKAEDRGCWARKLISIGDFPRDSSQTMNEELRSMALHSISKKLSILESSVENIAKYEKSSNWLHESTEIILATYICDKSPIDQVTTLHSVLNHFNDQTFSVKFWAYLYSHSQIDTLEDYQIPNNTALQKAKANGLIRNKNYKELWRFVNNDLDNSSLKFLSNEILRGLLRSSTEIPKALDFAKSIIQSSPNQSKYIIKTFIMEATKLIKRKRLFHRSKSIKDFEIFLIERGLVNDEVTNYFIYSDLELLYFKSAHERFQNLLTNPNSYISGDAIDCIVKHFLEDTKLVEKRKVFGNDTKDVIKRTINLVISSHKHGSDIKPETWRRVFVEVGHKYSFGHFKTFVTKWIDALEPEKSLVSSSDSNHPYKVVFCDRVLRMILYWGFNKKTGDHWDGYRFLKTLEQKGVHVPETLVRGQLLKMIKILHRIPGTEIKQKYKKALRGDVLSDISGTVKVINSIHRN